MTARVDAAVAANSMAAAATMAVTPSGTSSHRPGHSRSGTSSG